MHRAPVAAAAVLLSSSAGPVPSRPLATPAAFAAPAASTGSPFALTASDGTGLELVKLDARAVIDEPLAFTELVLTFENPSERTLEGTFRITLPGSAAVSRFAMRVGEVWQEGEVVALDLARRIYEDFLHRRQDPALLEQAAGNEFSARVFPIPAKGTKEIVVSWSQELTASDARYVLPLAGLPELGALDVAVQRVGRESVELHKTRYVPSKDFEVDASSKRLAVRSGARAIVRVTAFDERAAGERGAGARREADGRPGSIEGGAPESVKSALVLVDTSASRALGFDAQVDLVKKLAAELGSVPVTIAAFDQSVELVYEGAASGAGDGAWKKLRNRRALGASDLQGALKWAAKQSRRERVLLVSDGVATAGSTEGGELTAAVLELKKHGVQRLDAVVVGGIRDADRLARLVTAGLPKDGVVADGSTLDAKAIAKKLGRATKSNIAVAVEDAVWQWPKKLDGMQPGDEALVYAEVPAGKPLAVSVGGRRVVIPESATSTADAALVERATVRARIGSLLGDLDTKADGPVQKQKIREEIIALSTAHRVLSPFTGMLVLETEEDFERYELDRKSLADVLTVGKNGIVRISRTGIVLAEAVELQEPEAAEEETVEKTRNGKKSDGGEEYEVTMGVGSLDDESEGLSGSGPLGYLDTMEDPMPIAAGEGRLGLAGSGAGGGGSSSSSHGRGSGSASVTRSAAIAAPVVASPSPAIAATGSSMPDVKPMPKPEPVEESQALPRATGTPAGSSLVTEAPRETARLRTVDRAPSADPDAVADDEVETEDWAGGDGRDPYEGTFAEVMKLLANRQTAKAVSKARGWHEENPGDVMALVAYGTALEAAGDRALAARVYGSIIDLFPMRADLRRFAGERLEHIGDAASLALAVDTFEKSVTQRPDHASGHRLLAYARVKRGEHKAAFDALEKSLTGTPGEDGEEAERPSFSDRADGADRILREDLALIGAAWAKVEPSRKAEIERRLAKLEIERETKPSLRFVLNWETDANDVDFHILDARGGHAYYSQKELASGGELYADVTNGYGPECFTIRAPKNKRAGPYKLKAHYYSRGPMGYGMGKLEIVEHDGKGGLTFEQRPFVVMVDEAFVDLGEVGDRAVR